MPTHRELARIHMAKKKINLGHGILVIICTWIQDIFLQVQGNVIGFLFLFFFEKKEKTFCFSFFGFFNS